MSWQRIDENTYIDDTLVTCAEYQLFIDEMREQGKYYQPDHWTTYQFPTGQAREPILGVRYSDAVAFCKWLTKREHKEWFYNIPNYEDAEHFPLSAVPRSNLGYWTTGQSNSSAEFMWASYVPKNLHPIDLDHTREILHSHGYSYIYNYNISHDPTASFQTVIATLDIALARNLDRRRHIDVKRDQALSVLRSLGRDLDIQTDIITILERIDGRSPAFEGIRLVKERKTTEDEEAPTDDRDTSL